jgi:hypothetical protein
MLAWPAMLQLPGLDAGTGRLPMASASTVAPQLPVSHEAERLPALAPCAGSRLDGPCPRGLSEWPPRLAVVQVPGSSTLPLAVRDWRLSPTFSGRRPSRRHPQGQGRFELAEELKQGLEAVSEAAGSTVARSRAAASGARLLRFRSHAEANAGRMLSHGAWSSSIAGTSCAATETLAGTQERQSPRRPSAPVAEQIRWR